MSPSDRHLTGLCAAATIVCLAILVWGRIPLLNFAAATPLVLYLPGFAVLRALCAEPEGRLESAVLRVALSLAIVIIVGLALNFAGEIARPGWLATLGAITLAANVVSLVGKGRVALQKPSVSERGQALWRRHRLQEILMFAGATGLAAVAVALSLAFAYRNDEFSYTELWIVPKQNAPDTVVIGLHNAEAKAENYAIELRVDRHFVQSWNDVSLNPGETWTSEFRWVGYGIYPRPVTPLKQSSATRETPTATISERAGLGAIPRVEAVAYRSNQRSVVYRRAWTAQECVTHEDPRGRPPCEF